MTQSKSVRKKKKTKIIKIKNEEKKAESTPPPTPPDKRRIAEENLREMIKAAHKMHKNYTRSLNGLSSQTSRATIGKRKESDEGRHIAIEMTKRSSRTSRGGIKESRSSIQVKMKRLSEEGPSRKCSIESGKKFDFGLERLGSRDDRIPRQASAVYSSKKHADSAQRQDQGEKARGSSRKSRESLLRISDYQVGSFVSLDLLDKMRCHESVMTVRPRKSTCRQNRHVTQKPSDGHVKKSKAEKQKKEENVGERKGSSHKAEEEAKRKARKRPASKRGRAESQSAPIKKEARVISQTKSMNSNPQSASSNPDSIISSTAAVGDFFSSNTSRSYFSSESDISKIDKKFMEILEAVTQTKISFEERTKQLGTEQTNDSNLPSTSETNTREPSELEQKLLDRISYLEQKLKSKEDIAQKKKQPEENEKGDVTPKTTEQLHDENNTSKPVAKQIDDSSGSNMEKTAMKCEKPNTRETEAEQLPKSILKRTEPVTEIKSAKISEDVKKRDRPQTATKRHRRDDGKQSDRKVPGKIEESSLADAESEKNAYKRVETWSIIKRLEKAFQTLGLNLEDLDNSDGEEDFSAKKKQRVKYVSSGQEKRVLPQSETLRRCQEAAQVSDSNIKTGPYESGETPFAIGTNGSGDKNMEYKRERNIKEEDLIRPPKGKKSRDNSQKEAYYACLKVTPKVKIFDSYDTNDLLGEKRVETVKSSRKRCGDDERQTAEHGIIPKKSNPNVEDSRRSKRYRKRSYLSNFDDGYISHGKSKRDYSLSISCSASSFSEDEGKKCRKRKKIHSLVREHYPREEDAWNNKNGKGDAMSQTLMIWGKKTDREVQLDSKLSSEAVQTNEVETTMKKRPKKEVENDELELKEIRHRHRKILSEIKQSLEKIKKQHNLWAKLRRQTRQFNRDCQTKQKMLASYLKDVETSYDRRYGDYSDVISRGSMQMYKKMRKEHGDWIMQMIGPGRDETMRDTCEMDEIIFSAIETDNETSTVSDILTNTSTEPVLTDTAEESYRRKVSICQMCKPKRNNEGIPKWVGEEWEGGVTQPPNNLTQLLEKLNRIIVTEKSQLEDLVLKASASSSRSTQSNKTKPSLSAKSSSSSLQQHHKGVTRPATTDNEISSSNFPGMGSSRQHKSKGNKKSGRDKSPDIEEGILVSGSRSFIRGDPGGRSFDSLLDSQMGIFEHRTDGMSQCGCTHLKKQAEEHRYRKGDPSFRFQDNILQHSTKCMETNEEDDDAWKRKLELERILRVNEKMFKRTTVDVDTHVHDYDRYITAKGRQGSNGRHGQQSIIIDHNRGEENEESQIVLGHASRHSGVSFGLRKHDRQAPHEYLKTSKQTESSHPERHHDKKGKKHHSINYYINAPGSSSCRLRDACCQTDNQDDYEDIEEMYLLEESGSSPSFN